MLAHSTSARVDRARVVGSVQYTMHGIYTVQCAKNMSAHTQHVKVILLYTREGNSQRQSEGRNSHS